MKRLFYEPTIGLKRKRPDLAQLQILLSECQILAYFAKLSPKLQPVLGAEIRFNME